MTTRGGEAIIDTFNGDDAYMVQADVKLNSGTDADIWVRYTDSNNGYRIRLDGTNIALHSVQNGKYTSVASTAYTTVASVAVKIKLSGTSIKAWVDGTLKINATDSTHAAGGVALAGDQPKFDNLKISYDNNNDDDVDDAGDDLVVDEDFASTSVTVSHDDGGNLIDDGKLAYTYDAWHRLVKVQASADSRAVTIQTAEFDATGRRMKKVVTNSGDLDATTVYLYDGHQIIETRDGSSNVVAQFIHGTRYIDELVMARITGKGDFYYHQDANWNVIAVTDLGGSVLERYDYTAYGEMTVHQETSFGDRDGDQDVDSADKGTVGVDCTGTVSGACRILDLDFDGDYDATDATDATAFDALAQGLARHPGRTLTGVDQPFGHQGLLHDAEIGSYQNRARQYDPATRRFIQRDPLAFLDTANGVFTIHGFSSDGGGGTQGFIDTINGFIDTVNAFGPGGGANGRLTAHHYADGMNAYAYDLRNPLVRLDPTGRLSATCDDLCRIAYAPCILYCRYGCYFGLFPCVLREPCEFACTTLKGLCYWACSN